MITIKYIPNLVDSAGREQRELIHVPMKTLRDYLEAADFPIGEHRAILMGKNISPEEYELTYPADGDEIIVLPDIQVNAIISAVVFVINAAITYAIAHPFLTAMYLYSIYYYLNQPKPPDFSGTGSGIADGSPTYGWDGIRTVQNVGVPMPIVYGEHRVGGSVWGQYITSSGDKNYLHQIVALSEGEISHIGDLFINDNPASNFDGITIHKRYGENVQDVVPNFNDIHNMYYIGANLTHLNTYNYTTVDNDVEAFAVHLTFPGGLFQVNQDKGAVESWSVTYNIQYKAVGAPTFIDLGDTTISDKTRSAIRRVFRQTGLAPDKYEIKVTRTSADSTLDPQKTGDLTLAYIDEIKTDDLSYPNTALIGVTALATDQLSSNSPNYTVDIEGVKVLCPKILNMGIPVAWDDYYWDPDNETYRLLSNDVPLDWDGETYEVQYCANPVWCLRDLLTNPRYGLGGEIDVSNLSAGNLLEMSQYCEEKVPNGNGGYEKRFRLDVVLDSDTKAFDTIYQLCSTFSAYPVYSGGQIFFVIDKPGDIAQLFGMNNIVKGSFTQSWKSAREMYNVVEVIFMNKDNGYRQETIGYDNDGLLKDKPDKVNMLRLFTTRTSYAYRAARYAWKVAHYVNRMVTFKTGIEGIVANPGDLIGVSHDIPQWGFSGRVESGSTSSVIKLDREVTVAPDKTYAIFVQYSNGQKEERIVSSPVGSHSEITVSEPFSQVPAAFDSYSFGETHRTIDKFRIISMQRENNYDVLITATEYNENVYDDASFVSPVSNVSSLSRVVPNVENLVLSEENITHGDGHISYIINVDWTRPETTESDIFTFQKVKIYISDNAGESWILAGETDDNKFSIKEGLFAGQTYRVVVVSTGQGGQNAISTSPYDDIELTGKTTVPADVVNFAYNFEDSLILTWNENPEPDIDVYEIRDVDNSWGVDNANLIFRGDATRHEYRPAVRNPGTLYIRARNTSGLYSESSVSVVPVNATPDAPTDLQGTVFFNVAKLTWTPPAGTDIRRYEVFTSKTNEWSGEEEMIAQSVGQSGMVDGKKPRTGDVDSATSLTIIDSGLIGFDDDFFVGDLLEITEGTGQGQSGVIVDFDGDTGTITVEAEMGVIPDETSKYVIFGRLLVRVRAVDAYGSGVLSSAYELVFEQVDEGMLGDKVVTARKIYVGTLSAISANMGEITAGTVTGATFQTACSGARTVFDSYSIKSYDEEDNLNLEIRDGNLWARSAKFEDPACNCNYSYLSSGALQFHDRMGDVPYVKRICSGNSETGDTVELLGWTSEPQVMVGIKSLRSYDANCSGSSQLWEVYYDNMTCFSLSEDCYGYTFNVHAKLYVSGTVGSEELKDVDFGTSVYTASNTCEACVRSRFQLWCNPAAPSTYRYGVICYALRYRKQGDPSWCACCYRYDQPHGSTAQLKSTYSHCVSLVFPCNACWEINACQVSLNWCNTSLCFGSSTNCISCRSFSGTSSSASRVLENVTGWYSCNCSHGNNVNVGGSYPSNVFCTRICYCWCTVCSQANRGHLWTYVTTWGTRTICATALGRLRACASGYATSYFACCVNSVASSNCERTVSYGATGAMVTVPNCNYTSIRLETCTHVGANSSDAYTAMACADVCLLGGFVMHCYTVHSGSADSCTYRNVYSLRNTSGDEVILDPHGKVNWLAIAYN